MREPGANLMTVHPSSPSNRDACVSGGGNASSRRRQPKIVLLGMGGTIASSAGVATQLHDYTVTDTVEAVLAAVPQARELADIRCEQLANIDSHAIDNTMLLRLARRAEAVLQE